MATIQRSQNETQKKMFSSFEKNNKYSYTWHISRVEVNAVILLQKIEKSLYFIYAIRIKIPARKSLISGNEKKKKKIKMRGCEKKKSVHTNLK